MYRLAEHFKEKEQLYCRPRKTGAPVLDPIFRVSSSDLTLAMPLPTG